MRTKIDWRSSSKENYNKFCKVYPSIKLTYDEWLKEVRCKFCDSRQTITVKPLTVFKKYIRKWEYQGRDKIKKRVKEINTRLVDVDDCDIDTTDWPDLCDSFVSSAYWFDGTLLEDEELEHLNEDRDFCYEAFMNHLF